tara:strand:+ start:191 stop:1732 length:1542 start_codon:yes stop_codon:yes gene_type:complete
MAGRSSLSINKGNAGKVYTNTTGGSVVASIHMVSSDSTKNPTANIAVSSNATTPLNFTAVKYALAQNATPKTIDADIKSTVVGTNVLGVSTAASMATRMTLNNAQGSSSASDSYSGQHMYIDPYFLTNPEAYGKTAATHIIRGNNYAYLKADITTDRSQFSTYLNGTSVSGAGTNQGSRSFDYYDAGGCACTYTDTFINFNTNGYMSGGGFYDTTSDVTQNRTSDSAYYGVHGALNPNSYKYNHPMKVDMASDAGLFVYGMSGNWGPNTQYRMGMISANKWKTGADWDGVTWQNYTNGASNQSANFVHNTESWVNSFLVQNDGGYLMSWMKYNLATQKFYCNMQGTGNNKGIYSFNHNDAFPGSGVNSSNQLGSFTNFMTLEPTSSITGLTTEPMRIGATLWQVVDASGTALYSTNLIQWVTAAVFTGQATATALFHDALLGKNSFIQGSSSSSLLSGDTGYSALDASGHLENGVGVGVYERNGLILNSGDCIYIENTDASTNIQATVMFVEV